VNDEFLCGDKPIAGKFSNRDYSELLRKSDISEVLEKSNKKSKLHS
jgi:hypothetical protein